MVKQEWQNVFQKLEAVLEEYLVEKAPTLSIKAKEFIVSILPWLSLIFGSIGFLGSLKSLRFFLPFYPPIMSTYQWTYWPSLFYSLSALLSSGFELLAVPHLFKKRRKGWQFLYYSSLISAFSALVSLSGLGLIISSITLYFLFQVKEYYL